jgi:hypothetical protein
VPAGEGDVDVGMFTTLRLGPFEHGD